MHLLFLSVMIYPLQHTILRLKCSDICKKFRFKHRIMHADFIPCSISNIVFVFEKNHKGKKQQQLVQLFGNSTANPCWESFGWKPHEFCRRRLKLCFQSSIAGVWCTYMYIYLTGRSRTSEGKINFKCK